MLREVGKRDVKLLKNFLDRHAVIMPRTMLRYSLEKLQDKERKHYMGLAGEYLIFGSNFRFPPRRQACGSKEPYLK